MKNWIYHKDVFYNLDKFTQIQCGDDCEILLAEIQHNDDWIDLEDKQCILKFENKQERDQYFEYLVVKFRHAQ